MTRRHPRDGMWDRWIPHVLKAKIDGETRSLLLYLALRMGSHAVFFDGMRRSDLAEVFDVSDRRIAERFQRAQAAGLLSRVAGGYNGAPAVWGRATIPTTPRLVSRRPARVRDSAPLSR